LRSGAKSPLVRFIGHAFALACALLAGAAIYITVLAAFKVDHAGITAWLLGAGLLSLTSVVVATVFVARQPHLGGYFLVALVCLAAKFVCFVSWIPVAAF